MSRYRLDDRWRKACGGLVRHRLVVGDEWAGDTSETDYYARGVGWTADEQRDVDAWRRVRS